MTIDVNQQLFEQRRTAIASGRWSRRDDGSWVAADKAEVLGREGLDTTLGQAALYTSTPAWHGLGNVIPGGVTDIDEVLRLGGIDFTTEVRTVRYSWKNSTRTMPDRYVTVRDDTGDALGVVGKIYEPIQNRAAFTFLQELVANFDVTWESAGALRGGRKVFVCMRMPENVIIDAGGVHDEIVPFFAAINSHDGSSPFQTAATPWRIVCGNTERFALRDAYTRWSVRHVKGAIDRVQEARDTLQIAVNYYDAFQREAEALARADIAIDQFNQVISDLWPLAEAPTSRSQAADERRRDKLHHLFTESATTENCRGTAYAAERAITEYLDWLVPLRPKKGLSELTARGHKAMDGEFDDFKTKTHKRLMLLVHR